VPDILRYRGDTAPIRGTLTTVGGGAYDLTDCTLKFTCTEEENPPALFTTLRASGTLGVGTDTDTAAAVGKFEDAVVGDLFYNATRDRYAFIAIVTSDDQVELDREITGQVPGDSFQTGVSAQKFQIRATIALPLTGGWEFTFTAAEADFFGFYWYDIQLTDKVGKVFTLAKGHLLYRQDITK
jgi:hypothetical protein